jgi:hypothetical protein
MRPGVIKIQIGVSTRPVVEDGADDRLNFEVLPVLRAMREAVNQLSGDLATATTSGQLDPRVSFLLVDATSAPVTVTLPLATTVLRPIYVMKTDASSNAITVQGQSPSTVNGGTISIGTQNAGRVFMSDLVNFWSPTL